MLALRGCVRGTGGGLREVVRAATAGSQRCYADPGMPRALQDKESATENLYFNKEDERLLRQLLSKVKQQSDITDEHAAVGQEAVDESALKSILGKYNVSEQDYKALLKWKHN